jgi:hypothetical protein
MSMPDKSLTAEMVDQAFPLQAPGGLAEIIKSQLAGGNVNTAQAIYADVCEVDHSQVMNLVEDLIVEHQFLDVNLDVIQALRVGVEAGLKRGRQEGANVLKEILPREGE